MRVATETRYVEVRDALAADWQDFLAYAIPEALWVPIPNIGELAVEWVRELELTGIILTGGNDIGEFPQKDATDRALLRHGLATGLPVLGVCRGLQVIADAFGVAVHPCERAVHVASEHPVELCDSPLSTLLEATHLAVNSFHAFAPRVDETTGSVAPMAVHEEWTEALHVSGTNTWGVMWHPERGRPFRMADRQIVRHLFLPPTHQ
jgi:gamma-glutamyl-gamma-aminobutyrate hydrolase PuuD